ncbi:MAG: hypothetical protein DBP02_18375 [gamma proteobacterium symbiont of Ctena orbiculata]|nr:MAG: hypothetical protein DBP02_18375 [gamma proteobacterium symbiont of Ctena orbiculata]
MMFEVNVSFIVNLYPHQQENNVHSRINEHSEINHWTWVNRAFILPEVRICPYPSKNRMKRWILIGADGLRFYNPRVLHHTSTSGVPG